MDVGDEVAGCDEHEDADEKCRDVEQEDEEKIELNGNSTHIIGVGIEFHDTRVLLQQHEAYAQNVAQEHTLPYHEDGKPEERVANGAVAGSYSLQDANHRCALKNDDEQSANHRDAGYGNHQGEDDPHVQVEQLQPGENLRVQLLDGLRGVGLAILIDLPVHLIYK